MTMTRKEAIKFWKFRYQNARVFSDPHWEAQERREHREYVEALRMAIEALQGDMYCPNCGVRLVPENEYLEPTQTHGRLIDADALSKKLCETTIFIKDGEVFQRMINDAPTVQADQPHGEWISEIDTGTWMLKCSVCGCRVQEEKYRMAVGQSATKCPYCGAELGLGGYSYDEYADRPSQRGEDE